jgi:hypothetical protein
VVGTNPVRYYNRLARASALVLVSIGVHLWIDGRRAPGNQPGSGAATATSDIFLAPAAVQDATVSMSPRLEPAEAVPDAASAAATTGIARDGIQPHPVPTVGRIGAGELPRTRQDSGQRDRAVPGHSAPPGRGELRTRWPDLARADTTPIHATRRLALWTHADTVLPPMAAPALAPAELRGAAPSSDLTRPVAAMITNAGADAPGPPPATDEEASILQVLRRYERAVARKDPLGAKAVWPSLDDRALARAFNDLQSHSLALEGCGVKVDSGGARAICQGVATYLPKVGRRKPITASHEWTFNLARNGGGWHIESAAIQ